MNADTVMVNIIVTDVDEAPDITGDAAVEFEENGDIDAQSAGQQR